MFSSGGQEQAIIVISNFCYVVIYVNTRFRDSLCILFAYCGEVFAECVCY